MGDIRDKLDISQSTYVRIGLVVAVLSFAYVPYQWLDARFADLEKRFQTIDASFQEIAKKSDEAARRIELASQDRWTRTDQRLFVLEMQVRNPKVLLPEVSASR